MNSPKITEHWAKFPLRDSSMTIDHPRFLKALARLEQIVATPDDTWLAQLVSSTGAGKTHCATVFHGSILEKHGEEMRADPKIIPSVYVSLRQLSDKAAHNWSDDSRQILKALGHPNPRFRDLSEARDMVQTTLVARSTEVLTLDESAHIISGCDPNDLDAIKRRANVIKSFTEDTQTKLILCGTYALIPMIRVDGQVARRNQVVHLERYRNTPSDRSEFLAILQGLDVICGDYMQVQLAEMETFLYRGCLGLIGVLRNWLVRASTCAEHGGQKCITMEDFKEMSLSSGELIPILEEAINGEEALSDTLADQKTLSDLLVRDGAAEGSIRTNKNKESEQSPKPKRKKTRNKTGRPKPRRNPTGHNDDDPPSP